MVFRLLGNIGSCCIVNDPTKHAHGFQQPCNMLSHPIRGGRRPMASAVWSGHLHFGLVVMPVRLLVAARPKTTRFRRLHRKPLNYFPSAIPFPFSANERDDDSDFQDAARSQTRSDAEEEDRQRPAQYDYSPVRQVLQSEATGEEIRPDELA